MPDWKRADGGATHSREGFPRGRTNADRLNDWRNLRREENKCLTPQWSTVLESAFYFIEKFSQLQFKTRLLYQTCHGPCWKVARSSARLLLRSCLAIAKC
jgi:hypothetical protein